MITNIEIITMIIAIMIRAFILVNVYDAGI